MKEDGVEATLDTEWWHSLLDGKKALEDWSFNSPRPTGTIRPSTAAKSSIDRQGRGNPATKAAFRTMNADQIEKDFKLLLAWFVENEFITIVDATRAFAKKWPKAGLVLTDYPGNGVSLKFRWALGQAGITQHDLEMRRGKKISVGIRNSPRAMAWAAKMGQTQASSPHRVTIPQRTLHEMLKIVSPNIKMEFGRHDPALKGYYSYDFYCPILNSVIEMHGRVWHDKNTKAYPGLKRYVDKNIPNDIKKKAFAETLGFGHHVFWDDQQDRWNDEIERLYGKTTITAKEAKNIVRAQPWPAKSL